MIRGHLTAALKVLSLAGSLVFPAGSSAQQVVCTTNYYSVTGATLREIQQSFREARPWKARFSLDAFTVWTVTWRFSGTHKGSACRVASFSTTANITITLPRWVAPTNASEAVQTEWNRYLQALGQHEYGHAQFALTTAGDMLKRIKEVGEDANCEALKQRVNALCQGILQTHKQMDAAYDQRTDHGATQGARLRRGGRP